MSGVGVGTINYATGSTIINLSALPDAGSSLIYIWATPQDYAVQTYASQPTPGLSIQLANVPVKPESLTINWAGGTASANAAGVISGNATGTLQAATGKLAFSSTTIPESGTVFTVAYQKSVTQQDVFSVTGDSFGVVTFTLAQTPIKAGSVHLTWSVQVPLPDTYNPGTNEVYPLTQSAAVTLTDDGIGGWNDDYSGTINYVTGVATLNTTKIRSVNEIFGFSTTGYRVVAGTKVLMYKANINPLQVAETLPGNTTLRAKYTLDSTVPTNHSEIINLDSLRIDLSTSTTDSLLAGSLRFAFAGSTFIERQGLLYRNHNVLTDSAAAAGSIDYQTGIATLTSWTAGANALSISSAASIKG